MRRTTIRNSAVWLALAVPVLLSGCSDEYGHERLPDEAPEAARVREMIAAVREAGPDRIDAVASEQAAGDLDDRQRQALVAALREVAEADAAELRKLDAYGPDVLRASIELRQADARREVHLLVVRKQDRLLWAGPN